MFYCIGRNEILYYLLFKLWTSIHVTLIMTLQCTYSQDIIISDDGVLKLRLEKTAILRENLEYLSKVESATVLPNNMLGVVASNPPLALIYDSEGSQKIQLGRDGSGPFEYRSPSLIRSHKDTVVIWDRSLMKFIFFDQSGMEIEEIRGFQEAIGDFVYFEGNLFLYLSGGRSSNFIALYDNNTLVRSFAIRDNIFDIFMRFSGSGGIAYTNPYLLYVHPAEPTLHIFDSSTKLHSKIPFQKSDFYLQDPKFTLASSNFTFEKLKNYLFNNSRVSGIFCLDQYIIVETENGSIDHQTRETRLYIFDKKYRFIDSITISFSLRKDIGENIIANDDRHIHFITEHKDVNSSDIIRKLTVWKVVSTTH